jgi:hypothetical protein
MTGDKERVLTPLYARLPDVAVTEEDRYAISLMLDQAYLLGYSQAAADYGDI